MPYATRQDVLTWMEFYGVAPLDDNAPYQYAEPQAILDRLLEVATRDVQRFLGFAWDLALLDADQADALRDATAQQAAFRVAQGLETGLGTDDGLASAGPLNFSLRPVPRFSPEAAERLAGYGLFARSGTVPPDVPAA
jgi:hypothetical protein